MKNRSLLVIAVSLLLCCFAIPFLEAQSTPPTTVYSFLGTPEGDGAYPLWNDLMLDSAHTTFYGMTNSGGIIDPDTGPEGMGVIFKYDLPSETLSILHAFTGPTPTPPNPADGARPFGTVTFNSTKTTLYGMTPLGGSSLNQGIIFSIDPSGTGYTILHNFMGGSGDGASPSGGLIFDPANSDIVYGMTAQGGTNDQGTIFRYHISTDTIDLFHSFGGTNDGANPCGTLVLQGPFLYGMTQGGDGTASNGTVFLIDTSGSNYQILHFFGYLDSAGTIPLDVDGSQPYANVTLDAAGTTLFGCCVYGGGPSPTPAPSTGNGIVFKLNAIDGSGYTILHQFGYANTSMTAPLPGDGANCYSTLLLDSVNNTLYGVTDNGGASSAGAAFTVKTDGSDYTILASFVPGAPNPTHPRGSLTFNPTDSTPYGMSFGGGGTGLGTIYKLAIATPTPTPTATPTPSPTSTPTPSGTPIPTATPSPTPPVGLSTVSVVAQGKHFLLTRTGDTSQELPVFYKVKTKLLDTNQTIGVYKVQAKFKAGQSTTRIRLKKFKEFVAETHVGLKVIFRLLDAPDATTSIHNAKIDKAYIIDPAARRAVVILPASVIPIPTGCSPFIF